MDGVQDISDRQLLIALKSREQQSERNNELIAFTAWLPAQQTPDTGVGGGLHEFQLGHDVERTLWCCNVGKTETNLALVMTTVTTGGK